MQRQHRNHQFVRGALALAIAFACGAAAAQGAKPQYGGTLQITTVYPTISPLSFDLSEWHWKQNHDTGMYLEQLFAADLDKSVRKGGKHRFVADAWLPSDGIRGELAESWKTLESPFRVEVKLRKGVMFPEKPGVMASRELTAEDIAYTFNRQNSSPKKVDSMYDYVDNVKVTDRYTVVFNLKEYNAEWAYRFGYGYYSGIVPKEVVEAGATNWKNINGTAC